MLTTIILVAILGAPPPATTTATTLTPGVRDNTAHSLPAPPTETSLPSRRANIGHTAIGEHSAIQTGSHTGGMDFKEPAPTGDEQNAATKDVVTAKLGLELEKWGKLNVEGLSRTTVTWIVILVIIAVIVAAWSGISIAENTSGSGKAIGGSSAIALVAGTVAFLFLRGQFANIRVASDTANTTRYALGDISEMVTQQQSRIRYLESRLAELNGQLASISQLQASVLVQQERLKQREQDLAESTIQLEGARTELKVAQVLVASQAKEIVWLQNGRLLIWALCIIALVWIITTFRSREWSARAELERRRFEYERQELERRRFEFEQK